LHYNHVSGGENLALTAHGTVMLYSRMSESESEDEILDRIEAALRKIASLSKPAGGESLDRAILAEGLDQVITRLRTTLDEVLPPEPTE
jgi:hypothetical protein